MIIVINKKKEWNNIRKTNHFFKAAKTIIPGFAYIKLFIDNQSNHWDKQSIPVLKRKPLSQRCQL